MDFKVGVFIWEVCVDMFVYGLWMLFLCFLFFLLVVYGFGDGNLGSECNECYFSECDMVYWVWIIMFVSFIWFVFFFVWEMINL